ncbi:C40 family peptidase [Streptomyces sp. GS7]|uniref:C40 family peptidase n=1 Tax=Streptomyces sp. GS7 TaxID=2692234 RepID=UPI001F17D04A|nr:NlpC/P60 family protein [Streptomyces sp. GS7]
MPSGRQPGCCAQAAPRPEPARGCTGVALSQIGIPYVSGGDTINGPAAGGFDCSGLTSYAVYQATGHQVVLPRTSQEQRHIRMSVPRDQRQPGDLIVFDKGGWGHVGFHAGSHRMIDAPDLENRSRSSAWPGIGSTTPGTSDASDRTGGFSSHMPRSQRLVPRRRPGHVAGAWADRVARIRPGAGWSRHAPARCPEHTVGPGRCPFPRRAAAGADGVHTLTG